MKVEVVLFVNISSRSLIPRKQHGSWNTSHRLDGLRVSGLGVALSTFITFSFLNSSKISKFGATQGTYLHRRHPRKERLVVSLLFIAFRAVSGKSIAAKNGAPIPAI